MQAARTEIIQHPSDLMIGDAFDCFRINYNFAKNNQIGDIFTHFAITISDWVSQLLKIRNLVVFKINHQRFFVGLFVKSVPQRVQNSECTTNDFFGFHHMNPISFICVHPVNLWLNFFRRVKARPAGGGGP